jgi:hypothetical protein
MRRGGQINNLIGEGEGRLFPIMNDHSGSEIISAFFVAWELILTKHVL